MGYIYSDPSRESSAHALPDVEVFYADAGTLDGPYDGSDIESVEGWYWQPCFPGCLPDGDLNGPFDTREAAVADARETFADFDC